MKGNSWRGITLSILLLLAISEVMGTDYWISPFGSDSNNGLSASTPFKTFKYALTRVSSTGVLYVLPGLYSGSENSVITVQTECTIISTEGVDRTIVTGPGQWTIYDYVTISGIQFTNFPATLFSLYSFSSTIVVTLNNITAYNNNLVVDIESSNTYLYLYNSNFTSNTMVVSHPQSSSYNGGITMENSTIVKGAGGITGYYDNVSIINSTFSSIRCAYQGCALSLNRSESLLINQTTFIDCISSTNGGAIWLSSLAEGGIIVDSVFLQNTAVNGGAIYSLDSIEITDSKFISNYASSVGGGIYLLGSVGGSVGATISETDFEKNTGATSAGAVYCQNSVIYYQYVDFTQNYAPIGASYQCGSGCSTYVYEVTSTGNDPSCPSS